MFRILVVGFLFYLAFGCLFANGQSRRNPSSATQVEKTNRREATTPTPTPTPSATEDITLIEESETDSEVIRVETELVNVPTRVMDRSGRFIAGLAKENFKVFEDGVEKEIAYFSNEQKPLNLVLVLDMSYSGKLKAEEIQQAAVSFLDQLRPDDKVMVISFDENVHVLSEFTKDRKVLYGAIRRTAIASGTSVYDAMNFVFKTALRKVSGRNAVVLFSDGVDTTSRDAFSTNNIRDALEADALIYPIEYDTYADVQRLKNQPVVVPQTQTRNPVPTTTPQNSPFPFPIPQGPMVGRPDEKGTTSAEYQRAHEYLDELANRTGGRVYPATSVGNLSDAFSRIASELREFYSLGYYPSDTKTIGKRHTIKVKVDLKGVSVRARDSFVVRKPKAEKPK
jgi:VWFA-related protein